MAQPQSSSNTASGDAAIQILNMTPGVTMAAHVICAAAHLGIADLLKDGPRSAEELVVHSRTHAASLYRLLRALTTAGVVAENPRGVFVLTGNSETRVKPHIGAGQRRRNQEFRMRYERRLRNRPGRAISRCRPELGRSG